MTTIAYWRPSSVMQALELLEHPGAVVLAGGTRLNATRTSDPVEVVDLQALDLAGVRAAIATDAPSITIGAMTRLQDVVDDPRVPDVVREAARRERPSTLRAQGTIGGCVATGHPESELLATLLVHEARLDVVDHDGPGSLTLEQALAHLAEPSRRVITAVTIRTGGAAAAFRTARTPADRGIVAAVARRADSTTRVALTGVAATPVLVAPDQPLDSLDPPGDFRGSPAYRRALAEVLRTRALEAIA